MKRAILVLVLTAAGMTLLLSPTSGTSPETQSVPSRSSGTPAPPQAALSSHTYYIVWEALNILDQLFVGPESILTAGGCTCDYSCGGNCPPCIPVRRAKAMGPYCTEEEAWADLCSKITDAGTYAIWSPCPYWVVVSGVKHTVSWSPWLTCGQYGGFGGDTVIPTPNCPTATPTRTATVPTPTATPTATPAWDIQVQKVEITQGVQCLDLDVPHGDSSCADNSVPLVANRTTVIRVFPKYTVQGGKWPTWKDPVSAILIPDSPAGSPIQPRNGPIGLEWVGAGDRRESGDSSLNFRLPADLTRAGTVRLHVEINHDRRWPEPNYDNNRYDIVLTFNERPDLTVLYVPVIYDPPGPVRREPLTACIKGSDSLVRSLYPLRQAGFHYIPGRTITFRQTLQGLDDSKLRAMLNRLYWTPRLLGQATAPDQLFARLPGIDDFGFLAAADPLQVRLALGQQPLLATPLGQGPLPLGRVGIARPDALVPDFLVSGVQDLFDLRAVQHDPAVGGLDVERLPGRLVRVEQFADHPAAGGQDEDLADRGRNRPQQPAQDHHSDDNSFHARGLYVSGPLGKVRHSADCPNHGYPLVYGSNRALDNANPPAVSNYRRRVGRGRVSGGGPAQANEPVNRTVPAQHHLSARPMAHQLAGLLVPPYRFPTSTPPIHAIP